MEKIQLPVDVEELRQLLSDAGFTVEMQPNSRTGGSCQGGCEGGCSQSCAPDCTTCKGGKSNGPSIINENKIGDMLGELIERLKIVQINTSDILKLRGSAL